MSSSSLVWKCWCFSTRIAREHSKDARCDGCRGEVRFENPRFPSQVTESRGHTDPADVGAVNCISSGTEKGHRVHEMVRYCNARKGNGKQSSGRGKQSKSWSKRGRAKERVRRVSGNPKGPKVPKVRTSVRVRTLVYQVLTTRNERQVQKLKNLHRRIQLTIFHRQFFGLVVVELG